MTYSIAIAIFCLIKVRKKWGNYLYSIFAEFFTALKFY